MAASDSSDFSHLALSKIQALIAAGRTPPVDQWHPEHCGHSHMRIAADGRWWHEGRPIQRIALVHLFASILRREEDGRYVLVTPAEKLDIDVEDLPFLAVELRSEGEGRDRTLLFRTTDGTLVRADAEHAIDLDSLAEPPAPQLQVRGRLAARIARPVYYELVELALAEAADPPGLWSAGHFFPLAQS